MTLAHWLKVIRPSMQTLQVKSQLRTDHKLPNKLPPFDISAALLRVKGDSQLLHKLILTFYHDYVDTSEKLHQLISDGHYQDAERLAHTLKGAAMLLEVPKLPDIAAATEQAIRERNPAKIKLFIKVLDAVLTPAIQAAASLLPVVCRVKHEL